MPLTLSSALISFQPEQKFMHAMRFEAGDLSSHLLSVQSQEEAEQSRALEQDMNENQDMKNRSPETQSSTPDDSVSSKVTGT